jgi:hypothetical protein
MTVERAKIDRVCGLSKQIIVTQKQDRAGLMSVQHRPRPRHAWQGDGYTMKSNGTAMKSTLTHVRSIYDYVHLALWATLAAFVMFFLALLAPGLPEAAARAAAALILTGVGTWAASTPHASAPVQIDPLQMMMSAPKNLPTQKEVDKRLEQMTLSGCDSACARAVQDYFTHS